MDTGASLVWPDVPHNLVFDWEIGDKAATEAEFAKAAHVTKLTIVNNRIVVNSMEARAALADFDAETGRWTLYANTQGGWLVKNLIGPLFGTDPENFRIVTPDVGGGFGMKLFLYAEHVLTCYAARKLGRPVKWAADRGEAFLCDTQGRDNLTTGRTGDRRRRQIHRAADPQHLQHGRVSVDLRALYPDLTPAPACLPSVYGFKAIYANVLGVFTNTVPVDAYRGAGRPESNYLVERLVDAAARELKHRPVELRRRNMVPPDGDAALHAGRQDLRQRRFPRRAGRGDSSKWTMPVSPRAGPRPARAASGAASGLAYYLEATGGDPTERAEIRFADDGFVDVYVGTQSTGQGHETAYVQLTANKLGIDGDKIRIRQGDTDTIPVGGGTGGARSLYSEGQAILKTVGIRHRERQAGRGRGTGGRGRRHRLRRRPVLHRRHRPRHRHHRAGGDAAEESRRRAAGDHAGRRRDRRRSTPTPSRTAATWPRSRSIRKPASIELVRYMRLRRLRQDGQSADRARPGRRRRGAGLRPGGAGAHRVRPVLRPVAVRQLHGLRPAARQRVPGHRGRTAGNSLRLQSARASKARARPARSAALRR